MDNAAPSPKICTVCGQDCSTKPRTKDAQGRYVCKECMQRAQSAQLAKQDASKPKAAGAAGAAAGASAAGDQGDNAFLLDIIEAPKVREGQKPCPACGKGINEGAVLCTSCGFNLKTGERALVNVLKPVEIKDKSERNKGGGGFSLNIHPAILGLMPLFGIGGMLFASFETENQVLLGISVIGVFVFLAISWIIMAIDAFRSGEALWGAGLLAIPLLPIATAFMGTRIRMFGLGSVIAVVYWLLVECESSVVKWMVTSSIVLFFSFVALAMANAEWLESLQTG